MIDRAAEMQGLATALRRAPVVLLTGPRQAGKSTLAGSIAAATTGPVTRFDVENPRDLARLQEPLLALEAARGLVVIDEAQHVPTLFPVLRVLADRPDRPATFLVLGSASPDLVGLSAESLAGRVELIELGGLRVDDVGVHNHDRLWLQGGLPRAFTSDLDDSIAWRQSYIATFLERDLPNLGVRTSPTQMRRFWTMVAHYHGQTWNGAELARALGVSQPTVRTYLDALTDALVVTQLQPWHANVGKRVVKSPKIYIRDSGVLHTLLGIESFDDLLSHPKVGASWEGFVVEQLSAVLPQQKRSMHFWGTHGGAELDLLFERHNQRIGVEVKRSASPKVTPSIRNAIADLDLHRVYVVAPGHERYPIAENVEVIPLQDLAHIIA